MTDRTYQAVEHLLSPMQLIDLILVVGYYSMLAKVLKTLDVELDEAEIGERLKGWKAPRPHFRRGVMAKYASRVVSASLGATTT